MKVGNLVGGLEVVDVKRVNKLNLIQFLKEVDNYLQQGYKLDVNSARQVGLVLSVDVYKAEKGVVRETETTKVEQPSLEEPKETETPVEDTAGETSTVDSTPEKPVKKPTTTRSKKTT